MKKFFALLTVFSLMLSFGVSAASAEDADMLAELELFRGTGDGYELEYSLTGYQAAVMAVRLMGDEREALLSDEEYDGSMPRWAYYFMLHLRDKNLAEVLEMNDLSKACDMKTYLWLMLSLLGYEAEMARYADVYLLALDLGIVSGEMMSEGLTRGNACSIARLTLCTEMCGEGMTLMEKLENEKVIPEDSCEKYLPKEEEIVYKTIGPVIG